MVKTNTKTAKYNIKQVNLMPVELEEIIRFMKNLGYEVRKPGRKSVVDELLGAFESAIPEGETSTEYLKKLRERFS